MKSSAMKALALLFCTLPALAADATGKWDVAADFLGTKTDFTCAFEQHEKVLTGKCQGEDFPEVTIAGEVIENTIRFSYTYQFAGADYFCTYNGSFGDDGNMKGSIVIRTIDGVTGAFTAKKQS